MSVAGLDVQNRPNLLNLLHSLHQSRSPRVILGLRAHDPVPDWITHVALLRGRKVVTGPKDIILREEALRSKHATATTATQIVTNETGVVVADLKNVRVQYDSRVVLSDINWQIRQGERWHLQGENGMSFSLPLTSWIHRESNHRFGENYFTFADYR